MRYSQTMNYCYEAMKMNELEENVSEGINVNHNVGWKNQISGLINILHLYKVSEHAKQSLYCMWIYCLCGYIKTWESMRKPNSG